MIIMEGCICYIALIGERMVQLKINSEHFIIHALCNYGRAAYDEICKEIANSALGSFFAVLPIDISKVAPNFAAIATRSYWVCISSKFVNPNSSVKPKQIV